MTLKEKALEIQRAFERTKEETASRLEQLTKDIDEYTEEYKIACEHGDLRENAAYEEAVKNLQRSNAEYAEESARYAVMESVANLDSYIHIGIIVLYTTVQLKCIEDGSSYVYRIFPAGVSDLERGILAEDSRIGTALCGQAKGDTIKVSHNISGMEFNYVIEDIY